MLGVWGFGPIYYDINGMPISMKRWAELFEGGEGRPLLRTDVWGDGRAIVSTVWLGLDHSYGNGPPLIFETLVFYADGNSDMGCRYSTRRGRGRTSEYVAMLRDAEQAVSEVEVE